MNNYSVVVVGLLRNLRTKLRLAKVVVEQRFHSDHDHVMGSKVTWHHIYDVVLVALQTIDVLFAELVNKRTQSIE